MKNLPFEWFVALRYLKAKRREAFISFNTFISIAGVAIGVMALIVVISVMGGFIDHLRSKILGVNAHIHVRSYAGAFENTDRIMGKIMEARADEGSSITAAFKRLFGKGEGIRVLETSPIVNIQALLNSDKGVHGVLIRGVDPETITRVVSIGDVVKGQGIEALKENRDKARPPIILGKGLSTQLGIDVGRTVQVVIPSGTITPVGMLPKIRSFRVAGINSTGMYEYDSSMAFVNIKDAQRLLNIGEKVHGIEIKASDIYGTDRLSAGMEKALGFPFWVVDWQQMSSSLFAALKLEKLGLFVVLTLIVLVAAFNIVGTLVMVVMEKHQDIAILKAIGASDRQILKIFIYNGLLVGLSGTFLGVAGGIGLCELLSRYKFIEVPAEVYFTDTMPILLNPYDVVMIAISAVIICFFATIYPARKAARVNPSEALRSG
jgi:lipoprotein-releasing system permease protein